MGSLRSILASVAALLVLAASASAAPVDRTEKYAEYGFSIDRPSRFEARPVPPDVAGLVLVFAPRDAPEDALSPVTHSVFRVDGVGSAADVRRWIQGTLQPTELEEEREVRKRYGRTPARFVGKYTHPDVGERELFVHAWLGADDAVIFVGECEPKARRRETRSFKRVAKSFRFFTSEEASAQRSEWERRYRRSRLPHIEERIEVGVSLVAGWAVRDTEHSIILFHGPSNSPVLDQVARDLVSVRARFAADLPPDREIDQLSVVRICRDRGEYLTYGGSPTTVGYFNPGSQELVLYDGRTDRSAAMEAGHPTLRTLYHEACHQFLHHTASALSPHSWYDEGTAEFYAGALIANGRVRDVLPLQERTAYLQRDDVSERIPPLERLLVMTQEQFYADAAVNYSTGYALIRFLRTSRAAQGHPRWRDLCERYFFALRTGWRVEAEALALKGITGERYGQALGRARAGALEAALTGVDVDELERAFRAWLVAQ